jgi:hypothetical protein
MRLSVDSNDPGYNPKAFGAKVYLNGAEVTKVITADEDRGMLIRYQTDQRGKLILNSDRSDALRETRYGIVRIDLGKP